MKKYIESIIKFQKKLFFKIKKLYPDVKDYWLLFDLPKRGDFQLNKSEWYFYKHGTGVKFTRNYPKPSIVIDMHRNFDNPFIIDEWRVIQYLESINVFYSEEQVNSELSILSEQGYLHKISGIPTLFLYKEEISQDRF